MARQFTSVDEAATQLARNLFDDFNKGYVALGQFRGKLATEIERAGDKEMKRTLGGIDIWISSAQDELDKALDNLRLIAPGTILQTLGRKPHHLPGR